MDICSTCGKDAPSVKTKGTKKAKKNKQIGWICCDSCNLWFHTVCVRISDLLLPEIGNFWYFCTSCTTLGMLIAKSQPQPVSPSPSADADIELASKKIQELTTELTKLKTEMEEGKAANKKQFDRIRSHLNEAEHHESRNAAQNDLINNNQKKIEVIENGAKLASTCSSNVNSFRIAVNKIPLQQGECVRNLIGGCLSFLVLS